MIRLFITTRNLILSLINEIDRILSIGLWKFDGLPSEITTKLDYLLEANSRTGLLKALDSLVSPYQNEEKKTRECMGNSGTAAEFHMAAGMKLKYLHESIEYLNNI